MRYAFTIHRKTAFLILTVALFGLFGCGDDVVGPEPYNAQLDFYQVNFDLDGNVTTDSAWGSVDLTHDGSFDVLFFNLAVDGRWVIQNVPVLSFAVAGGEQTLTFDFDLGVNDGTDVTQLEYAFDLATTMATAAPTDYSTASVSDLNVVISGGAGTETGTGWVGTTYNDDGLLPGDPPEKEVGGEVVDKAVREGENPADYVGDDHSPKYNQDCGKGECVPTAVSNSLKWLRDKNSDLVYPEDPTIEKMKGACGFRGSDWGCPPWSGTFYGQGELTAWQILKDAYMREQKYPITTMWDHNLGDKATRVGACDDAIDAVKHGKDVELHVRHSGDGGHGAMVVAVAKVKEEGTGKIKYVFYVAHDTEQGPNTSGTKVEKTIYDPENDVFEGGKWIDGGHLFIDDEDAKETYAPIVIEEPSP